MELFAATQESNAPRPPPRPGEFEVRSTVPDVLPGAGPNRLHGLLGRSEDGSPRIGPTPLPSGGLSDEERRDSHRGFCFNSRVSDSLPLDRKVPDQRSEACVRKHAGYPRGLPAATVVIVFFNENLSALLRSVHSVLNLSPPELLDEVILVDDASEVDGERFYKRHWDRLQDELTEYCKQLPKTRLVRLVHRRGLMLARMEGVWRSKSRVTVFLDSHVEATAGWLEPLLARIAEDPRHVVVPSIDTVGYEDFRYRTGGGLGAMSFSWTLGQRGYPSDTGDDGTEPAKSPVMCGGLFATDTRMFLKLGGYDPEMRLYGGEEMEIGFRTWMCGGDIEYVPCSHVGHIFRSAEYWQGQVYRVPGEEIARNKLRTAEVWMDDYKQLVQFATSPLPKEVPMGDLEPRRRLREKLQCKDFNWYLKHAAPSLFVPKLHEGAKGGSMRHAATDACLDTLGRTGSGEQMGAYPCHGLHGTQAIVMDGKGLVRLPETGYSSCIMALPGEEGVTPVIETCGGNAHFHWRWNGQIKHFVSFDGRCLQVQEKPAAPSPFTLALVRCTDHDRSLEWDWYT